MGRPGCDPREPKGPATMEVTVTALLLSAETSKDGKMIFLSVVPEDDHASPTKMWAYADADGLPGLLNAEKLSRVRLQIDVYTSNKGNLTAKVLRCLPVADVKPRAASAS